MSLQTATAEWKLRQANNAIPAQDRVFRSLVEQLARTSHWKQYGVEPSFSYADFRSRVPLHTYEQLAYAVARMQGGEADVLWPGHCSLYALTAGTSCGIQRPVPMTDAMMEHVRRTAYETLLYYTVRAKKASVARGRHLLFGSPPALKPVGNSKTHASFAGELSGIAALTLPAWAERHVYEPGVDVASREDWQARLDAITERTRNLDITLLGGLPTWLVLLGQALRDRKEAAGAAASRRQKLWPNLECCVHTGLPAGPYIEQLRAALGPDVRFHELYTATEGGIAVQDTESRLGLRLLADHGVFFEFLPATEFDATRIPQLGNRAVPLRDVKAGVDYVLLLTAPNGFARYVLGDVVRFTSLAPHRLVYVGGTTLRLDAFGEKVSEKDATDVLTGICQRHNWSLVNFHVAPQFHEGRVSGPVRGRHEWWVELIPGTVATPTGPQIAAELEVDLSRANATYAAQRKAGAIDAPVVRLVMPGVFEHWLRYHSRWGGQAKVPRCRSDRVVADELAGITQFARD